MKNLAILAVVLGFLSGTVYAESAVNETPLYTLALNSDAAPTWLAPAPKSRAISKNIELEVSKTMAKLTTELEEKLENKIAKELDYAMQ